MYQKKILVTGGAGFIGSNFIEHMVKKYPTYQFINLDLLTYAGNLDNLTRVKGNPNHRFIQGDIRDNILIEKIFHEFQISDIIHLAAESHVDNSISGPTLFYETNIMGTISLLEACRKNWTILNKHRFHHVSTDEVYGSLGETGQFSESTPYAPNSPYSSSKAGSDFAVRAYGKTYGLNFTISNCSNNYGPMQNEEKLIPVIIKKALRGEKIPIYGKGTNIRDWLYVADHCSAIDLIFHNGKSQSTYNIGTDNELTNLELAKKICATLDELVPKAEPHESLISFVSDRPGHDFRYSIDSTKIKTELGWKTRSSFSSTLRTTIQHYIEYFKY